VFKFDLLLVQVKYGLDDGEIHMKIVIIHQAIQ